GLPSPAVGRFALSFLCDHRIGDSDVGRGSPVARRVEGERLRHRRCGGLTATSKPRPAVPARGHTRTVRADQTKPQTGPRDSDTACGSKPTKRIARIARSAPPVADGLAA